ncbi:hypothetical protein BABINDRAFT_171300 [Babjeviella inositovora NRRL Y-12698]|uniref:Ras-GEF domain-containing protein n=1 Tax=Babjeviella inositovora NRRL Y-12698 TaxID=984486 RepID=A0A1E3QSA7_9ASCO|nr:uncharacterized protein BABINDRAFT_171300 [Babjeviella inositovora NRRL Y-12698]ODQ80384.1 hypothetical protein BABINDRAFT_171300 [Babjeviella inositovora NRRL Y-12698]
MTHRPSVTSPGSHNSMASSVYTEPAQNLPSPDIDREVPRKPRTGNGAPVSMATSSVYGELPTGAHAHPSYRDSINTITAGNAALVIDSGASQGYSDEETPLEADEPKLNEHVSAHGAIYPIRSSATVNSFYTASEGGSEDDRDRMASSNPLQPRPYSDAYDSDDSVATTKETPPALPSEASLSAINKRMSQMDAFRDLSKSRDSFQFYDQTQQPYDVNMDTTLDTGDYTLDGNGQLDSDGESSVSIYDGHISPTRRHESVATQVLMVKNDGVTIVAGSPVESSSAFSVVGAQKPLDSQTPRVFVVSKVQPFSVFTKDERMRGRYTENASGDLHELETPVKVVHATRDVTPKASSVSEYDGDYAILGTTPPKVHRYSHSHDLRNGFALSTPRTTKGNTVPIDENGPATGNLDETIVGRTNELSALFYTATHAFDALSLKAELDASICLSFKKDDICFVHSTDPSGWGEVTLILNLQRGWVPMNYFRHCIEYEYDKVERLSPGELAASKQPLKLLFAASAKFLREPMCVPVVKRVRVHDGEERVPAMTFPTKTLNSVRDGVRSLLEETECISRTSEIVAKRPTIKKIRKVLLADWFELMRRAVEYKYTTNTAKVDTLQRLIYQVLRKAVAFLDIWGIEADLAQSEVQSAPKILERSNTMSKIPYLKKPPFVQPRVTEIHTLLFNYLGLIIGRLDLIEHNPVGCELLENITHQIILLLRELLFINKIASASLERLPPEIDSSLDLLLSLVSELVSGVKKLVAKTALERREGADLAVKSAPKGKKHEKARSTYYYTAEGGSLIEVAAKMVRSVARAIYSIRRIFEVTGDTQLDAARQYPDFYRLKIDPETFIRKCSVGLLSTNGQQHIREVDKIHRRSARYSTIRMGKTGALGVSADGAAILNAYLPAMDSTPFVSSDAVFQPFTTDSATNFPHDYERELLTDNDGHLIGGSFRSLVYTLTNEASPPQYFFISSVLMTFRIFSSGIDLVEELISRFDITNSANTDAILLNKRRKLICGTFQIWLESYWNHQSDYPLLSTLINFFNEGVSLYLPRESSELIEVAARLASRPPVENTKDRFLPRAQFQLVERRIREVSKADRNLSMMLTRNYARYSMVDGYELGASSSSSVAIPLGVTSAVTTTAPLVTPAQVAAVEKINMGFRTILGKKWCPEKLLTARVYVPVDLDLMITNWYRNCYETWVLTNYRTHLLDFNALELAKQLTIIESRLFCAIRHEELLNENFAPKKLHLNLAPHVARSVLFTNCLSEYVLESMLQPDFSMKQRVANMQAWLKVAVSCLYLRNFNSLAAIITSLQSFLISRLGVLWDDLLQKYTDLYEYLSSIVIPDKNYSIYRAKLKTFLISSNIDRLPLVPYVSLFLQDLTFIVEGNPNYRSAEGALGKLINIDKYLKATKVISDFESLQVSYVEDYKGRMTPPGSAGPEERLDIAPVPALQELVLLELWKIKQLNIKEDDRAWKLSCLIQPRE